MKKIWFPEIDKQVEAKVNSCITCQASTPIKNVEPPRIPETANRPWERVSMDFCGPFPSGDNYTRFPEVEILKSIGHTSVIRRLDKIFATHGIPAVAKSDNGPPFNGTKFENFAKYQRINASLHTGPSPMEKPNDL